jgi:hypothetical protein
MDGGPGRALIAEDDVGGAMERGTMEPVTV